MLDNEDLYRQYDLLLPPRYDGGFLVLALFQKIDRKELPEYFTESDLKSTLKELDGRFGQGNWQTDRMLKTLHHYFIKNVPDQFGKYYLSDYAKRLIKVVKNKLENPYKNYPLRETFEKYFTIRIGDIRSINDLEIRFGQDFVAPHKSIIENHLDGLQDELQEAHHQLSGILISEELTAIQMVHQFVIVFSRFGERAEDIGNAIHSKDRFLKNLHEETDKFYQYVMEAKTPENEEEIQAMKTLNNNWVIAGAIYNDLSDFFESVDQKLDMIHKQILFATEKLLELQENFSSRSNFRLAIKRLLNKTLDQATYDKGDISFSPGFPLKSIPYDRIQFFYPDHYHFDVQQSSPIIHVARDEEYESQQLLSIELQAKQSETINEWLDKGLDQLASGMPLILDQWIAEIFAAEKNIEIALQAGFELLQRTANEKRYHLKINSKLETINELNLQLWNIRITEPQMNTLS